MKKFDCCWPRKIIDRLNSVVLWHDPEEVWISCDKLSLEMFLFSILKNHKTSHLKCECYITMTFHYVFIVKRRNVLGSDDMMTNWMTDWWLNADLLTVTPWSFSEVSLKIDQERWRLGAFAYREKNRQTDRLHCDTISQKCNFHPLTSLPKIR